MPNNRTYQFQINNTRYWWQSSEQEGTEKSWQPIIYVDTRSSRSRNKRSHDLIVDILLASLIHTIWWYDAHNKKTRIYTVTKGCIKYLKLRLWPRKMFRSKPCSSDQNENSSQMKDTLLNLWTGNPPQHKVRDEDNYVNCVYSFHLGSPMYHQPCS